MRIYVGGLAPEVTEDDIRELFDDYGRLEDVRIITDGETGASRGFAFVEMEYDDNGDMAIEELNDTEFKGHTVMLTEMHSRGSRGGRRGYGHS